MNGAGEFVMTIGGQPIAGVSRFPVENPATGEVIAQAPECSEEDVCGGDKVGHWSGGMMRLRAA